MKDCENCKHGDWAKSNKFDLSPICLSCKYVDEGGLKVPSNWKPQSQTNADRIRAMSDEELAAWLMEDSWDCHDCPEHERLSDNPLLRNERCDEKCKEHCLGWLKQPVKDGEGE